MYVDDTAVVADSGADLQERLVEWKDIFGGLGLRVSLGNTVYCGALDRAASKKTSRNKIGWEETEPTFVYTSWGECLKENGRGDGIWTHLLEAKGKGVRRMRNTSLRIRPSDNGGGRENLETASLRV